MHFFDSVIDTVGIGFEQIQVESGGQEALSCCDPCVHEESGTI